MALLNNFRIQMDSDFCPCFRKTSEVSPFFGASDVCFSMVGAGYGLDLSGVGVIMGVQRGRGVRVGMGVVVGSRAEDWLPNCGQVGS